MYILLVYLACTAPNGLYHAAMGRQARPRSVPTLVSNLAAMASAGVALAYQVQDPLTYLPTTLSCPYLIVTYDLLTSLALAYQDQITTFDFLFYSGFVAITCNSFTMGMLARRRALDRAASGIDAATVGDEAQSLSEAQHSPPSTSTSRNPTSPGAASPAAPHRSDDHLDEADELGAASPSLRCAQSLEAWLMQHPWSLFWVQAVVAAALQCLPFFCGLMINQAGDRAMHLAVNPPQINGTTLPDEARREHRKVGQRSSSPLDHPTDPPASPASLLNTLPYPTTTCRPFSHRRPHSPP